MRVVASLVSGASVFGASLVVVVGAWAGISQATAWTGSFAACDAIDFNNIGVFPEDQDVVDFFNVLAGAECA